MIGATRGAPVSDRVPRQHRRYILQRRAHINSLIALVSLCAVPVCAQEPGVRGRVVDLQGEPVPGVTVEVKHKQVATVTDSTGRFHLERVALGDTLVVRLIGFANQEVPVDDEGMLSQTEDLAITLDFAAVDLEQVVLATWEPSRQPRPYQTRGSFDDARRRCTDSFFPLAEIRSLSSLPISVLITKIRDETTFGPATGLDVLGFWITPVRPKCGVDPDFEVNAGKNDVVDRRFLEPTTGATLSFFTTATASYTVFPVSPPEGDGAGGSSKDVAESGAFFSLGGGAVVDVHWLTRDGTRGNRIAIGGVARYGYFTGTEDQIFTVGPVISLSIF